MPNDLQNFSYQAVAQGLETLKGALALPQLCNYIYDPLKPNTQASVKIPSVKAGTVRSVQPSVTPQTPQESRTGAQYLDVTTWKEAEFYVTDDEWETVSDNWLMLQMKQKVIDLATFVNADIIDQAYRSFYATAGTVGTPLFTADAVPAINAAEVLTRQFTPTDDRVFVMDTGSYYRATGLQQFAYLNQSGEAEVMRDATVPKRYGFNWLYDQQMGNHVTGAAAGYQTGANAAGLNSIVIQTGAGAWVSGDIIIINGQNYVVQSGTTTSLNIMPALRAATTAGTVITKLATHGVNMAFQKEAIAFATRPLPAADALHNRLGKQVYDLEDPSTGLSLRVVWSSQNNQTQCSMQILYGIKVVRPEFGCRVIY